MGQPIQINRDDTQSKVFSVAAPTAEGLETKLRAAFANVTTDQDWALADVEVSGAGAGGKWLALVTLTPADFAPPWNVVPGAVVVCVETEGSVDETVPVDPQDLLPNGPQNLGVRLEQEILGEMALPDDAFIGEFRTAGSSDGHRFLALAFGSFYVDGSPIPPIDFADELGRAFQMGAVSADPAAPVQAAAPGTYWLGEAGQGPGLISLSQADGTAWEAPVDCELYAFAVVQDVGIGAGNVTYTAYHDGVAIADTVVGVSPTLGGYTRIPIDPPEGMAAGEKITVSVDVLASQTLNNARLIFFPRPI